MFKNMNFLSGLNFKFKKYWLSKKPINLNSALTSLMMLFCCPIAVLIIFFILNALFPTNIDSKQEVIRSFYQRIENHKPDLGDTINQQEFVVELVDRYKTSDGGLVIVLYDEKNDIFFKRACSFKEYYKQFYLNEKYHINVLGYTIQKIPEEKVYPKEFILIYPVEKEWKSGF